MEKSKIILHVVKKRQQIVFCRLPAQPPNRLLRVIDAGNSIAMGIQYLSLQFDHYDN